MSMISVKGLQKSFGKHEVLKGIDIEIQPGEVVAIVGPSGCGKSTFLRCLNLLEKPTGGQILYHMWIWSAPTPGAPTRCSWVRAWCSSSLTSFPT